MRVVFLDFDGVLNTDTASDGDLGELWSADWLVPELVERLAELVRRADARVVVSSSWRQRRTQEELAAILAARGFEGGVFDVTPRLPRPPEGERLVRAAEIGAWLAGRRDVESFVVLDDDPDFGALTSRHVRTNPGFGLTAADVERALEILLTSERS